MQGAQRAAPLSAVLLSGLLHGVQAALLFVLSFVLHLQSPHAFKRNLAFALSSALSLYLLVSNWRDNPVLLNCINIAANAFYLCCRYALLHGLPDWAQIRIL
jgi:hypothetical protein